MVKMWLGSTLKWPSQYNNMDNSIEKGFSDTQLLKPLILYHRSNIVRERDDILVNIISNFL